MTVSSPSPCATRIPPRRDDRRQRRRSGPNCVTCRESRMSCYSSFSLPYQLIIHYEQMHCLTKRSCAIESLGGERLEIGWIRKIIHLQLEKCTSIEIVGETNQTSQLLTLLHEFCMKFQRCENEAVVEQQLSYVVYACFCRHFRLLRCAGRQWNGILCDHFFYTLFPLILNSTRELSYNKCAHRAGRRIEWIQLIHGVRSYTQTSC